MSSHPLSSSCPPTPHPHRPALPPLPPTSSQLSSLCPEIAVTCTHCAPVMCRVLCVMLQSRMISKVCLPLLRRPMTYTSSSRRFRSALTKGTDSLCLACCIIKGTTVWQLNNNCIGHSCSNIVQRGGGGGKGGGMRRCWKWPEGRHSSLVMTSLSGVLHNLFT